MDTYSHLYGFRIVVHDIRGQAYGYKNVLIWKGYRFHQFSKWKWYFMYRYGLELVKNPKHKVEFTTFKQELDERSKNRIELDRLKNKISSKRRLITRLKNAISEYEEEESKKMFFVKTEKYINTNEKLEQEELELLKLEKEFTLLTEKFTQNEKNT
jgi:hypothetical protein